jgi:hypothetical protein
MAQSRSRRGHGACGGAISMGHSMALHLGVLSGDHAPADLQPTQFGCRCVASSGTVARIASLHLLGEGDGFFDALQSTVSKARVRGAALQDARIAAICVRHGVERLLTTDRDFSRYPALRTANPLRE